jgi:azurin
MKKNLRMLMLAVVLGVSLMLTACGGGGGNAGGGGGGTAGGGAAGGGATTIDIGSDGENLAFDKTTLEATAGQPVTLNFKNNSAVQQHNWVLVKGGEDVAKTVADSGLTRGAENDFLPEDMSTVLAHTKVHNGGESETLNFTAPAAGSYLYICTVPGHYPLMQGTMTVK